MKIQHFHSNVGRLAANPVEIHEKINVRAGTTKRRRKKDREASSTILEAAADAFLMGDTKLANDLIKLAENS
jgi:hypothetical protein